MKFLAVLLTASLAVAAPVLGPLPGVEVIPGQWIVTMKEDASHESMLSSLHGLAADLVPKYTYKLGKFNGYSMSATDSLVESIKGLAGVRAFTRWLYMYTQVPIAVANTHHQVASVEPDYKISINAIQAQDGAPWGLARISSRVPNTTTYSYDDSAGEDTYAYIIDTGIFIEHPDFEGRATWGASFVDGDDSETDGHGHGTHVAGTTASKSYGVAKKANLIAVKVLDAEGSGSLSQVIAGIQWAVDDATSKERIGKAVANLSLGSLALVTSPVNTAAAAAVQAGLFLAVAAGNDNLPASLFTPASEPTVCTVGALDPNDQRSSFSNYGDVVDVFAPGRNIISTWNNGSTGIISGTSMATPHITGLGAYLLALEGERDPIALCDRIRELGTPNLIPNALSATSNIIAYNGIAA
ncbi:protease [Biscogniauxia mediterranea]|nr:protease [Biscogniauxia mediterranea]